MGLILYLLFGAFVGWVASTVSSTDAPHGILGDVVVGVVGALLGSVVWNLLSGDSTWGEISLEAFLVSLVGAVAALAIFNKVRSTNV